MAENKKGFLLYADYEELFDELEDVIAGKLIKHILKYVNDKQPTTENPIVNVAFIPIKRQLKRDLEKYEGKREQWSDAGKKSAEARRLKKEQELTELTNVEIVATELTVNDNVNVNVKDIHKDFNFDLFLNWFNKTTNRNFKSIPEATKKSFKARIKEGYTKEDICKAVINCSKDKFHIENPKYLTPEFISRADKLALYLSAPTETKTKIIIY
jgi:uncharacterized phage protein (TIGR02220 family)